jgi:ABC-type dipeptide/oligopeptide/nickel transport system permease component
MLNLKSLLKILPIVLLSFGPIVGMSEVARSQSLKEMRSPLIAQQSANQIG